MERSLKNFPWVHLERSQQLPLEYRVPLIRNYWNRPIKFSWNCQRQPDDFWRITRADKNMLWLFIKFLFKMSKSLQGLMGNWHGTNFCSYCDLLNVDPNPTKWINSNKIQNVKLVFNINKRSTQLCWIILLFILSFHRKFTWLLENFEKL